MTAFATSALLLALFGILLVASAGLARGLDRLGVPAGLLFLALGMLAGSEAIGGIAFADYQFAFVAGTIALIFIVFDGGFNTAYASIRAGLWPALALATVGVLGTAALVAVFGRWIGLEWGEAILLGAVVSSTDAATVLAVMRGSRLALQRRVATVLELESGLNDAVAVLLTIAATEAVRAGAPPEAGALVGVPVQLVIGGVLGALFGRSGRWLLTHVRVSTGGLYVVITLGLALLSFGITTLAGGSGFLAVFATAAVLGNGRVPYFASLRRIHDAVAWLAQVSMFLMLGLLVFPSRAWDAAPTGVLVGLFLAFVARPAAALLCLAPFRFPLRETGYIGWVGLRGAVPIVLASYPVIAGVEGAERIFDVVFVVVIVNTFVPGATIRWVTSRIGLGVPPTVTPHATLELTSTAAIESDLMSFFIDETLMTCDVALKDLGLPEGAAIALIVRGTELVAARGSTVLRPGDHVYVFSRPEDRAVVTLLFGRPEDV